MDTTSRRTGNLESISSLSELAAHLGVSPQTLSDRRHRGSSSSPARSDTAVTTTAVAGSAGILLLLGVEPALVLQAVATIIGSVGGVIGAWTVLVRIGD